MWGGASSRWMELVDQEPRPLLDSHSVKFHRISIGNANRFPFNSSFYLRLYMFVFVVVAVTLVITLVLRCSFLGRRVFTSGLRGRRLASAEGEQDDGDGQERVPLCENVEELLAAQEGEASTSNPPPPQPTGTSEEAATEEKEPRKKKSKTKRHAEDEDETSELQAKRAREREWDTDPLGSMESLLLSFQEPHPSSLPAPPFSLESAQYEDEDMLNKLLTVGSTTLSDWLIDPEGDELFTTKELRRPEWSADPMSLERTSSDFPNYPSSQAMEGPSIWAPPEDTEVPSTSGAVSGVQPPSLQPSLPHVSQPSQVPQSGFRTEGSAAMPRGRILREFDPSRFASVLRVGSLATLLRNLELLLRKERSDDEDLQAIVEASEALYTFVVRHMCMYSEATKADQLIRVAIRRLLATDALWRACNAVGPLMKKNEWWPGLISRLYGGPMQWIPSSQATPRAMLLQRIVAALEGYTRDVPPEPEELAAIMRLAFHREHGIPGLKGSEWDLWRESDEDS